MPINPKVSAGFPGPVASVNRTEFLSRQCEAILCPAGEMAMRAASAFTDVRVDGNWALIGLLCSCILIPSTQARIEFLAHTGSLSAHIVNLYSKRFTPRTPWA